MEKKYVYAILFFNVPFCLAFPHAYAKCDSNNRTSKIRHNQSNDKNNDNKTNRKIERDESATNNGSKENSAEIHCNQSFDKIQSSRSRSPEKTGEVRITIEKD